MFSFELSSYDPIAGLHKNGQYLLNFTAFSIHLRVTVVCVPKFNNTNSKKYEYETQIDLEKQWIDE